MKKFKKQNEPLKFADIIERILNRETQGLESDIASLSEREKQVLAHFQQTFLELSIWQEASMNVMLKVQILKCEEEVSDTFDALFDSDEDEDVEDESLS